jgi:hypothetical protein
VTCCSGISKLCNACAYTKPPSSSFLCPCCMVLRVLVFPLLSQIRVCGVECA